MAKIGTNASENLKKKVEAESGEKVENKLKNIARGTTDPGHWVYNLNHVYD